MACRPALQDVTDNTDIVEFFDTLWLLELIDGRYVSIALEIVCCEFYRLQLEFFESGDLLVKRVDFFKVQPQKKRAAKVNFIFWTLF